jgi:hypothetical protein
VNVIFTNETNEERRLRIYGGTLTAVAPIRTVECAASAALSCVAVRG